MAGIQVRTNRNLQRQICQRDRLFSQNWSSKARPEKNFRDTAAVVGIGAGRQQHGGHGIG